MAHLEPDEFLESFYGENTEQGKINPFAKILKSKSILDANEDEKAMEPHYKEFYNNSHSACNARFLEFYLYLKK